MRNNEQFDGIDLNILSILQNNCRETNAEVGRQVGLTPSAVLERVRKLQERGLIEEFTIRASARKLGFGITAFVAIRTDESLADRSVAERIAELPEVIELHDVAGEDCYVARVIARDIDSLHALLRNRLATIKGIRGTSTTIVMKTLKDTTHLPLGEPQREGE